MTLSLSMMSDTPGLGPLKEMTVLLWSQVMLSGGSGTPWIMQVMLITLPVNQSEISIGHSQPIKDLVW